MECLKFRYDASRTGVMMSPDISEQRIPVLCQSERALPQDSRQAPASLGRLLRVQHFSLADGCLI